MKATKLPLHYVIVSDHIKRDRSSKLLYFCMERGIQILLGSLVLSCCNVFSLNESYLFFRYKHIIEDKRTGGILINKKKEAWREVTLKYNSNCTSGTRETEQLKALYDNMKQKSRKIVAENNVSTDLITGKLYYTM